MYNDYRLKKGVTKMANNNYRKVWFLDKFARKYYCKHARLGQLRYDKKMTTKKNREISKKTIDNYLKECYNIDTIKKGDE